MRIEEADMKPRMNRPAGRTGGRIGRPDAVRADREAQQGAPREAASTAPRPAPSDRLHRLAATRFAGLDIGRLRPLALCRFLFSPRGRIDRSTLLIGHGLPTLVLSIGLDIRIFDDRLLELVMAQIEQGTVAPDAGAILRLSLANAAAGLITLAAWAWISGVLLTKRLHDLDRSGWWTLLGLIPVVTPICYGLLYLVPGSARANRYGPPPGEDRLSADRVGPHRR